MSCHTISFYLSWYHLEGGLELHLLVKIENIQKQYQLNKGNVDITISVKKSKPPNFLNNQVPPVLKTASSSCEQVTNSECWLQNENAYQEQKSVPARIWHIQSL